MAIAPLVLRIVTDATQTLKTNDAVISSNTLVGKSALDMGADLGKAAALQVQTSLKVETALKGQISAYRELASTATVSTAERAKAAQLASVAEARLAREQGISTAAIAGSGRAAQTAERDLGKLTRGALAGSGVVGALGRSLAFASTGFIAIAGTATLLHAAITEALSYAATQKQVEAQLKTSGLSFGVYREQIDSTLTSESRLSGFTRQDLLQSFGYLVRVSGDVGQSLKLDSVAADVARGRHIALSAASIALAKALGGSSTALRRLGIIVPKTATGMEAIRYVAAKFAGQAEAGATSADHLHASLVNASEVVGTAVLPTFNRLAGAFSDYVTRLEASGRLQRDVNQAVTLMGYAFHTVEGIIRRVDDVTGGFGHTVAILIGLELGSKILGWSKALRILAADWGLVGAAATKAGIAQEAAVGESALAGAGAGAGAGAARAVAPGLGAMFSGGLLGSVAGPRVRGYFASRAAASEIGAFGAGEVAGPALGALAAQAAGVGIAVVLVTSALDSLAKTIADKFGAGSGFNQGADNLAGLITEGFAGNSKAGIINQITSGRQVGGVAGVVGNFLTGGALNATVAARNAIFGPPPGPPFITNAQFQKQGLPVGLTPTQIFGPRPSTMFGTAQPMQQFWKQFTLNFREQMAAAQAALTKSNADDVAAAKQVVARIKTLLSEGRLKGPALYQALQLEANALSTIWSAEAAAAQKRAAKAQAAKQKIITQIQNAIDPIKLEVALSKALSLGQTGVPQLKDLLAAAYKGLAKAIAVGNQQLEKQAYDQIRSLKDQIKNAQTTAENQFSQPMKLQIALARAQAFGKDDTQILKEMKAAALKALRSGKYTGQNLIDLLNEIANINSQLNSSVTNAYGDYKKASVKALTASLGLTAAQRRALEERLSQRGPGGTTPEQGTGAAGYVIDPATGRPVRVGHHRRHHSGSNRVPAAYGGGADGTQPIRATFVVKVYLDSGVLAASTTVHQQRHRRHNPSSRRGPYGGSPTS